MTKTSPKGSRSSTNLVERHSAKEAISGEYKSILDENVPMIALFAANELHRLSLKEHPSLGQVKKLSVVLRYSIPSETQRGNKLFFDPTNYAVLSRAIGDWQPHREIKTTVDLFRRASTVVGVLENVATNADVQQLETMRDFCLALAKAASAYNELIYDESVLGFHRG